MFVYGPYLMRADTDVVVHIWNFWNSHLESHLGFSFGNLIWNSHLGFSFGILTSVAFSVAVLELRLRVLLFDANGFSNWVAAAHGLRTGSERLVMEASSDPVTADFIVSP